MDDSRRRGGGGEEEQEVVEKLPGFRFHPTEEELLNFYLKQTIMGNKLIAEIITFLNIYNYDPRELPGLAKIGGEREWYFFVPRKQGSGGRPNRTTEKGFWKATGSDRKILSSTTSKLLGLRKTLVFYQGRAPRGTRTDWIMNEYRLPPPHHLHTIDYSPPKDIVLCKIYRKATSMKVLEQRAAVLMEECNSPEITMDSTSSFSNQLVQEEDKETYMGTEISSMAPPTFKRENHHDDTITAADHVEAAQSSSTSLVTCSTQEDQVQDIMTTSKNLVLPNGMMANLGELQLPAQLATMDWTQDAFWSQFRSPWLDNFASFLPLCQ